MAPLQRPTGPLAAVSSAGRGHNAQSHDSPEVSQRRSGMGAPERVGSAETVTLRAHTPDGPRMRAVVLLRSLVRRRAPSTRRAERS
jgi:hypothetical protein